MKQRKGLACSMALNDLDHSSNKELKGDVYNIFPYIEDPKERAYMLPGIIDGTFFPIELQRIVNTVNHEISHFILSSAMVTCEERALGAQLLGKVWNVLIDADDDTHLLIPSFTIVGPARKVFELKRLAERLRKLVDAREAVHEIVARTMEVGRKEWDRNKAKWLIRRVVDDALFDDKALDGFLNVYENLGAIGALFIGHYALNAVRLTQRSALERFKRATKVACNFKPKDRQAAGPGLLALARLLSYSDFVLYLDSKLPGYHKARCPLAGFCLPRRLDSWAESLTNQSSEDGNPVPSMGERAAAAVYDQCAFRMRESRCDREEQLAQGNELFPESMQEILRWLDPEALSTMGYETILDSEYPLGRAVTPLALIEHDNCDYQFTVGVTREEKERPLVEISPAMFGLFMLEASLQQMMYGEGPLCLCYPHQPANCPYRSLLRRMWDCTEPDPEWENTWKQPKRKPRCIA